MVISLHQRAIPLLRKNNNGPEQGSKLGNTKMKTATITTADGKTYRATILDDERVTIDYRDGCEWIWAGDGKWDDGITDCAADLGDEAYEMLDEALSA